MTTKTASKAKPAKTQSSKPVVFIDGEAGTTGLEIRRRLAGVAGLAVQSIAADKRKDEAERLAMMRQADLVVLCLPDEAAKEAVALIASLGERRAQGGRCQQRASRRRRMDVRLPGNGPGAGGCDQGGHARLQSGLLSDRRHRADPAAGGGWPDAGRLSCHGQCRERLQRRRADHDRGLRRREGARLRALRPRPGAQARGRAAEVLQAHAAADLRALGRQFPPGHAGERAAASGYAARQAERARPGGGAGASTSRGPSW